MKSILLLLSSTILCFQQMVAQGKAYEINTKSGIHYLVDNIDYPVTGTYLFEGGEPKVELYSGGAGYYQLHEQPTRAVRWGFECSSSGEPKFIKGFNSAAYTLWYQYTNPTEADGENDWKAVEFTIHFNTQKMYIQGERMKSYAE